jgi:hypothetical protein
MNSDQNLCPKTRLPISKLSSLLMVIVVSLSVSGFRCDLGGGDGGSGGGADTGWKVWIKKSPCSGGRTDWVSVAKRNPTEGGGGGFWVLADEIITPMNCTTITNETCTFAAANKTADIIRASDRFSNYCCKDYYVWKYTPTGEMSVVKGTGSAGFGWDNVGGPFCCEEAEKMTGKTGLCGGTVGGGKTGFIGCYKDTPAFDLDGFLVRSKSNTPESCIATCRAKGFMYAAVQYGESCLCGNSYGKYGAADNCNYKCTGDSSKICGGYNANSVYGTGVSLGGDGGGKGEDGVIIGNDNRDGNKNDGVIISETPGLLTPTPTIGRWTLVSVTAIPETPPQGYSYSGAQSTSANMVVYNGDKHNFQWTKPPQQIDANGFTVSMSAQCQSQSRCASLIGVAGDGIDSDTPAGERAAAANGENGAGGSGQKSVTFKPTQNAGEIEVRVELMWGAVKFIYKYKRVE